ncbi:MAG: cupin domain-containing protein, partial [Candidatus Dormibacteria bacterium]
NTIAAIHYRRRLKAMSFTDKDGKLILAQWGEFLSGPDLPVADTPMYGTAARAKALVSNGFLGVDLVRIPAGEGFDPHTHIGDHLLIVVRGKGTITYGGIIYLTQPGQVYAVPGSEPHAVGAIEDHALLSVGAPHRSADAADRMALTEYAAVAASFDRLNCLACGKDVTMGGCPHAPNPRRRLLPLLLAPTWDGWETDKLAQWFGLPPHDLGRAVELLSYTACASPEDAVAQLPGRVVVAYGKLTKGLLSGVMPDHDYAVEIYQAAPEAAAHIRPSDLPPPALVITVRWAAEAAVQRVVLRLAHTLAAAGPLEGLWAKRDVLELGFAIDRALRVG